MVEGPPSPSAPLVAASIQGRREVESEAEEENERSKGRGVLSGFEEGRRKERKGKLRFCP